MPTYRAVCRFPDRPAELGEPEGCHTRVVRSVDLLQELGTGPELGTHRRCFLHPRHTDTVVRGVIQLGELHSFRCSEPSDLEAQGVEDFQALLLILFSHSAYVAR